ncbi:MAG: efflux RND transporter periplasmic adaptor subunit [Myxococcota bacterium]
MKVLKRLWLPLLLVPLTALMGINIVRLLVQPAPTLPRPVDVSAAARTLVPEAGVDTRLPLPPTATVGGIGVVEPAERELKIAAPVAGRIAQVAVVEGQKVAAGDVLVALDAALEQAAVATAEADVATARAELAKVTKGNRYEDVKAARADAEAARARAALSAGVFERTQKLAASGGTSADELDRAKRQVDVDRAAAAAAEARRLAMANGSRPEDVAVAEAQVQAAEARLAQARAAVERLTVRAPAAGEILQVKVRAGEWTQPGGDPLVTVGDTSHLRARLDIDERDIAKIALGASAVVRANAWPDKDFKGKVVELGRRMGRKNVRSDDPVERNDTKILEVVVALDAPDGLVVGQRVTAFLNPPTR